MAGADLCLAYQECPDAWNQTLKDNLAIGVALHDIKEVMVFTHQDCGAWKKFGILNKDMNLKQEIDAHREMAKKIKQGIGKFVSSGKVSSFIY